MARAIFVVIVFFFFLISIVVYIILNKVVKEIELLMLYTVR